MGSPMTPSFLIMNDYEGQSHGHLDSQYLYGIYIFASILLPPESGHKREFVGRWGLSAVPAGFLVFH